MKKFTAAVLFLALAFGAASAADGEALYTGYCQACHQADGEGIPGTYPFIGGPVKNLSTFDEGRVFLMATTLFGLKGEMVQRGIAYDGFMPGYATAMSDAEVADLLNWILEQASWKRPGARTAATGYTPDEVGRVRALGLTPDQVHELLDKVEEIAHAGSPAGGNR